LDDLVQNSQKCTEHSAVIFTLIHIQNINTLVNGNI